MGRLLKGLVLSLILLFVFEGRASALHPRVVHHDLRVSLLPSESRLTGSDSIRVDPGGSEELEFELAKTAQVSRVTVDESTRSFILENGRLRVPLRPDEKNRTIAVQTDYTAVFRDAVPDAPLNTDNPGYGVTGIVSEKGSFLLEGAGWYPRIPGSRPTYRLTVDAPEGILAVSAGKGRGHETRNGRTCSEWHVEFPLDGLSLSAGPYTVQERTVNGIQISTYFFAQSQDLSEAYLDATARYLVFYENLIGPYPFTKFAVVENFFETGYGFPSYTLLGSAVIRLPFIIETSLGHEIAHSWWGNGVLVDYEKGNWSEGLTTYLSDYLYKENSSREEAREYRLQVLRSFSTLVDEENDFPLSQFRSRYDPASQAIGYGKGAMVFHMIRRKVGDQIFWDALKEVYKEKLFQKASWKDFQEAFERNGAPGLQTFFDQWVRREGAPVLSLDSVAMEAMSGLFKVRGFVIQKEPLYELEFDLVLESESLRGHKTLNLAGPATLFEVPSFGHPLRLLVDPEFHMFRALHPSEVPPAVNALKSAETLTVVLSRRWQSEGGKLGKTLALSLGARKVRIVSEEDFVEEAGNTSDLLFVGLPEQPRNWIDPYPGLVIEANRVALEKRTFDAPTDLFFGVFQHPGSRAHVVGLFLPLSPGDFLDGARKITHYGKYSYLVFRDGKNVVKGTWPIRSSPMMYVWKKD